MVDAAIPTAAAAKSLQLCPTVRPQRRQPTRLPHPWDSPGKNTGVGCHFLLQSRKVKNESEVAQSCPTLSDPTDCSLSRSSVHRIFQARVLEWGAIAFSLEQANSTQKTNSCHSRRQGLRTYKSMPSEHQPLGSVPGLIWPGQENTKN